ncbi:MAG: polymer-forming cytoskeletal protein [candidate division WOR-3 bacterium]
MNKEPTPQVDTHIGETTYLKGEIKARGGIRIDGEFEGNIETKDILIIGLSGKVRVQEAKAKNVKIGGIFSGKLTVEGKAHLEKSARFDGELYCKGLIVEDGVIFNGKCLMDEKMEKIKEVKHKEEK